MRRNSTVRGAAWWLDEACQGAHDRRVKKRRLAGPEGRSSAPAPSTRASLANVLGLIKTWTFVCPPSYGVLRQLLSDRACPSLVVVLFVCFTRDATPTADPRYPPTL